MINRKCFWILGVCEIYGFNVSWQLGIQDIKFKLVNDQFEVNLEC